LLFVHIQLQCIQITGGIVKLEEIGFYTLEDCRAKSISATSPMWRCEMLLTPHCNFKCPYCRGHQSISRDCSEPIPFIKAATTCQTWIAGGLKNIRFSGGEPTLYPRLTDLVRICRHGGVKRIAISSNGSASFDLYERLVEEGVNDFSISLDSCCSSFGNAMTGVEGNQWEKVVENIPKIAKLTYVTVGVVLTEQNVHQTREIIEFAHSLGVADIRIISAAQYNRLIKGLSSLDEKILEAHPILKYRINNLNHGRNVRGIQENDCHKCYLVKDDSVVAGNWHFPCVIAMREGCEPIGEVGENMRQERLAWFERHNSFEDPICRKNCLDVCIDFNNRCHEHEKNKNI
jgi:molybdenum cofactor biosynthesis enzyme MoaA